ncbi:MAG: heparan-alpha-glucosaminide N-acetyltransferase domain-containing protein [Clostridia bacterium]
MGIHAMPLPTPARAERRIELDIGKGIAVLLMICAHVQEMYSQPAVQKSFFGCVMTLMTTFPVAPLFMFAMGVGAAYSRNQDAPYAVSRGGVLLLTAYLLNALRAYIPWWLGLKAGLLPAETIPKGNVVLTLLEADILQFAGLSLIFIGGLRAVKAPWGAYLVTAVLPGLLNYLVRGASTGHPVADAILGLFWGTGDTSRFPFLSWAFYPLVGVAFGTLLRRSEDKTRFHLYSLLGGCAVFLVSAWLVGFRVLGYLGIPEPYAYRHQGLMGNVLIGSLTLTWVSSLYFLQGVFPATILERLRIWSRNLTKIYIVHWVFIGWFALLVGFNRMSYWHTILTVVLVVIVADRLGTPFAPPFPSRTRSFPRVSRHLRA